MQAEAKVMRIVDPILAELDQEAEATRRLLDIIPEDKLDWRPHPKAKSLGELAMHIAVIQGNVAELGDEDVRNVSNIPTSDPAAESRAQISQIFSESLAKAKRIVGATEDEKRARYRTSPERSTDLSERICICTRPVNRWQRYVEGPQVCRKLASMMVNMI